MGIWKRIAELERIVRFLQRREDARSTQAEMEMRNQASPAPGLSMTQFTREEQTAIADLVQRFETIERSVILLLEAQNLHLYRSPERWSLETKGGPEKGA